MDCCEDPMAMYRVVCPKPRRVAPPNLNTVSLAPSRFHIRNNAESNDGAELLGQILRQDHYEALSLSPPFSFGSPPSRAQNPLVQDADFRVEKLTLLRETSTDSSSEQFNHAREKLGKKQAAALRVEGF